MGNTISGATAFEFKFGMEIVFLGLGPKTLLLVNHRATVDMLS